MPRKAPSPALVLALIALVLSLTGGAAATIIAHSARLPTPQTVVGKSSISTPGGNGHGSGLAITIATCPRGLHALGGGWTSDDAATNHPVSIANSGPTHGGTGWYVSASDVSQNGGRGVVFTAVAQCG